MGALCSRRRHGRWAAALRTPHSRDAAQRALLVFAGSWGGAPRESREHFAEDPVAGCLRILHHVGGQSRSATPSQSSFFCACSPRQYWPCRPCSAPSGCRARHTSPLDSRRTPSIVLLWFTLGGSCKLAQPDAASDQVREALNKSPGCQRQRRCLNDASVVRPRSRHRGGGGFS
jgi:hypothetical protein